MFFAREFKRGTRDGQGQDPVKVRKDPLEGGRGDPVDVTHLCFFFLELRGQGGWESHFEHHEPILSGIIIL